jgi:electron transfer flavoprotein beta subunit
MTVVSDMPDSLVTAKISLPCLISVEKDIHVPRLPSYKRKADSMKREITLLTLDNLSDPDKNKYGLDGSPTQVIKIFPPEHNNTHEVWKDGDLPEQLFNYLEEKRLIG